MCTFDSNKIYLTWRKALGKGRFIVGELIKENDNCSFKYDASSKQFKKAQDEGFTGYPAFSDVNNTYDKDVLKVFSSRLVSPQRSDYNKFLNYWCAEDYKGNDFALLGLTGAKLQTDNFEFIAPHNEVPASFYTEVAGLHHSDQDLLMELKNTDIKEYKNIILEAEPSNIYDDKAVKVLYGGIKLGYIKIIHNVGIFKALEQNLNVKAQIKNIIKNGSIKEILLEINISKKL